MHDNLPNVSIVLLTRNGEKYLRWVLEMIRRQKLRPHEVLAFDSESEDSSVDILREFDVRIHKVKRVEFSHSGTRNIATASCSGKYVVFLTQDAVPADSCWLECLLRPFEEFPDVAGTFSRQIPRPDANLLESNDIRQDFPHERVVKKLRSGQMPDRKEIWKLIRFSNSSSAYDRQLLMENPFAEYLEMAEDQEWAKRILEQNYTLVYEPASVVLHSHEHSLNEKYERSLKMGRSFAGFLRPSLGKRSALFEFCAWLAHVFLDLHYIICCKSAVKTKLKWMGLSPVHRAAIHFAYRKGWNSTKEFLRPSTSKSSTQTVPHNQDWFF
jgi:rhamnosyltransferase